MSNTEQSSLVEDRTKREVFGNDSRAINRHSVREYDYTVEGAKVCRVELDRTLDMVPPAYSASFIPSPEFVGLRPECVVMGCRFFGDGMSWGKAERLLRESLDYKYRNDELKEGNGLKP